MEKKQLVGLAVSAVIFVFVCSFGVLTKNYSDTKINALSKLETMVSESNLPSSPFVGIVNVQGVIMDTNTSSIFDSAAYNHKNTLKYIDDMINSSYNKGILLYVNSPGGGVYESDELYLKLKEYTETTERPVWAYMGSTAASGGFYISMASEKVYANRNTMTGSIGVIMSSVNYKELMDKIGVKTVLFTSGANKSMGNPGVDLTDEQRQIFQSIVDESYNQFLEVVSQGRGIDKDTLKPIADGRIYTANQALNLNLIDGVKTYNETVEMFKERIGENVEIFTPKNSFSEFSSIFSLLGKKEEISEIDAITEFLNTSGKGVPMYYEGNFK